MGQNAAYGMRSAYVPAVIPAKAIAVIPAKASAVIPAKAIAVIPAKAGIHVQRGNMDPRFRGDDRPKLPVLHFSRLQ